MSISQDYFISRVKTFANILSWAINDANNFDENENIAKYEHIVGLHNVRRVVFELKINKAMYVRKCGFNFTEALDELYNDNGGYIILPDEEFNNLLLNQINKWNNYLVQCGIIPRYDYEYHQLVIGVTSGDI